MCASFAPVLPHKCGVVEEISLFPYAVGLRVAKRSALRKAESLWRAPTMPAGMVARTRDSGKKCPDQLLNFYLKQNFLPFVILRSSEGPMQSKALQISPSGNCFHDQYILAPSLSFPLQKRSLWRGHDDVAGPGIGIDVDLPGGAGADAILELCRKLFGANHLGIE